MSLKLTSLTIAPVHSWNKVSAENPLRCVVKVDSEHSTIECVLDHEAMLRILDLCAEDVAKAASRRMDEFHAAVTAIDGGELERLEHIGTTTEVVNGEN